MERTIEKLFGAIVRRHREGIGISQEDFADRAEIHRTYVSLIERGKVQVSIGIAHKLSVALGVTLSRLWSELEVELSDAGKAKPAKSKRRPPSA